MKIKNFKNYIFILVLAFVSCEDAIDIQQVGRLTADNAYLSVDDLEQGLNGVYLTVNLVQEIGFNAEFSDEIAEGNESGGQGFNTAFVFNLTSASGVASGFWIRNYSTLNAVNRLIEGAQNIEIEEGEQDRYDDILGQAYALRAFAHFQLLSYFSTDYADDSALAAILVDFVPQITDTPLRSTNAEFYEVIGNDLDLAEQLIQDQSSSSRTFFSKDAVKAMKVRVGAYRQDYNSIIPLAQELLNDYPLATREEYPQIWTDESNAEIIFKLERTLNGPFDNQANWAGQQFAFVNATLGGGTYYEFGRSLFNLFDPADIRFDAFVAPSSIIAEDYQNTENYIEEDVLVIQKYPGSEGQNLMNDLKVYRSSEMALILAEAYASNGNINGQGETTAAMLKMIRDARFEEEVDLPSFSNQTEAFNAILNERRVELAFEGHRWKDVKRMGQRADQDIVRDPLDCERFGGCVLENDDYRLTMPLPQVEFNGNPGLRAQQNPGY